MFVLSFTTWTDSGGSGATRTWDTMDVSGTTTVMGAGTVSKVTVRNWGALSFNSAGKPVFPPHSVAFNALADGIRTTLNFRARVTESGQSSDWVAFQVTLMGGNDTPTDIRFSRDVDGEFDVTEAGGTVTGDLTATGSFTIADVDSGQSSWTIRVKEAAGNTGEFVPATSTVHGFYGSLSLATTTTTGGTWTYTLGGTGVQNEGTTRASTTTRDAAVEALNTGINPTDSFTIDADGFTTS